MAGLVETRTSIQLLEIVLKTYSLRKHPTTKHPELANHSSMAFHARLSPPPSGKGIGLHGGAQKTCFPPGPNNLFSSVVLLAVRFRRKRWYWTEILRTCSTLDDVEVGSSCLTDISASLKPALCGNGSILSFPPQCEPLRVDSLGQESLLRSLLIGFWLAYAWCLYQI